MAPWFSMPEVLPPPVSAPPAAAGPRCAAFRPPQAAGGGAPLGAGGRGAHLRDLQATTGGGGGRLHGQRRVEVALDGAVVGAAAVLVDAVQHDHGRAGLERLVDVVGDLEGAVVADRAALSGREA